MPIRVTCDCGHTMQFKDKLAGMEEKCPTCGTMISIPEPVRKKPLSEPPSYRLEEGWITSPRAGVVIGAVLMAIALSWFFLGLSWGQIYTFPVVLFVMGLFGLLRGLKGRQ